MPDKPLTPPRPPPGGPVPRKRPQQARSQITVDAVLEATAQVLVAEGYARTTMLAVAERAGVSIGTLYQYYPDKAALVAGVIEAHLAREAEVVGQAFVEAEGLGHGEAIDLVVRAFVMVNGERPERAAAVLVAAREVEWAAGMEALAAQSVEAVAALLAERADASRVADPDRAAFVVVSAIEGIVERGVTLRPGAMTSGALAAEACDLARRYLLPDA